MAETEVKKINGKTVCDDTARETAKKAQDVANSIVVPEKLPNPFHIKFTGAVNESYDGSEEKTIVIPDGASGKSAYEIAVENGFTGTQEEWLASLVGAKGDSYVLTEADKTGIAQIAADLVDTSLLSIIGEVS